MARWRVAAALCSSAVGCTMPDAEPALLERTPVVLAPSETTARSPTGSDAPALPD